MIWPGGGLRHGRAVLRHGRVAHGASGSARAHGLAAECYTIQCCDMAGHEPRYDREARDTTEEAATRRAAAHDAAGARCDKPTTRLGEGHDTAGHRLRHGRDTASLGAVCTVHGHCS